MGDAGHELSSLPVGFEQLCMTRLNGVGHIVEGPSELANLILRRNLRPRGVFAVGEGGDTVGESHESPRCQEKHDYSENCHRWEGNDEAVPYGLEEVEVAEVQRYEIRYLAIVFNDQYSSSLSHWLAVTPSIVDPSSAPKRFERSVKLL